MRFYVNVTHSTHTMKRLHTLAAVCLMLGLTANLYAADITNLRTEYLTTPIGIDFEQPRFSWEMELMRGTHGLKQIAYHVVVKNEAGQVVWDSERIASGNSLGIIYAGEALEPATRYTWEVTVWDNLGRMDKASSWFETGLMDPSEAAWQGAQWIGGGDDDVVFYPHYLSVFRANYTLQLDEGARSSHAGFILGANDARLMDKDMNIQGVESGKDESYVMFEIDITRVDGSADGLARLNIYRVGYSATDSPDQPIKQYNIPATIINNENKYQQHTVYLAAVFGVFTVHIDGQEDGHLITVSDNPNASPFEQPSFNVNPVGQGGNFIAFPMVADIGFAVPATQKAFFSNVQIRSYREPSNPLFSENLMQRDIYRGVFSAYRDNGLTIEQAAYAVRGGSRGIKVIADPSQNAMPMLRSEFDVDRKAIKKARLYATARGIYEMYINGKPVGDDYFNPGLTQYNITHMYQTYDVTEHVKAGANAIGAMLGEGWWSGNITFRGNWWNYFGDRQSLLAKLVIEYTDGTSDVVVTSPESWHYFDKGPVVYGSFFQGEVYDARREDAVRGWSTASYNDDNWEPAEVVPLEGTTWQTNEFNYDNLGYVGQIGRNAKQVMTLTAKSVKEVRPGVYVYDMGQNMVGVPEIDIRSGQPGQEIKLRYSEVLYPNLGAHKGNVGMLMLENFRAALVQDIYILKGGNEVISPKFTFHGYRYIEITGINRPLPPSAVRGRVISSVPAMAASFESSNTRVNKLWENITWSMRGNFLSIPTDTPARNERMGWSGDLSVFSRSATFLGDVSPFLRRHMLAMRDMQRADGRFSDVAPVGGGFGGTLWGSAGVTTAWESYLQYGDKAMLEEHYPAMKRYMEYLASRVQWGSGILDEGPLGDWLSPENGKNDNTLLWAAYYVFDLEILTRTAEILGKREDAANFWLEYTERKNHFNLTYVDEETGKTIASGYATRGFGGGEPKAAGEFVDTQASYAVPLALGVFDEKNAATAAKHLVETVRRKNKDDGGATRPEYSLMTGFIGTAWISKALSDFGYDDEAYRLLQQRSYPSWLYPVDQGATTIWERLNSYTLEDGFGGNNSMNSFNHYSFGAVGAWMYNYSLGIERDETQPGFKHFVLQPTPDPTGRMTYARGHIDSMYGRIESSWEAGRGRVTYQFTVPANTTATLLLRASSASDVRVGRGPASSADGVQLVGNAGDRIQFELASGRYTFIVR